MVQILENALNDLTNLQELNLPDNQTYTTTVGNVGTTETVLYEAGLQGNFPFVFGWIINIRAFGTFAGNTDTKELKLYLNDTVIYDSGTVTSNGGTWGITAVIVQTPTGTQQVFVTTTSSDSVGFPATAVYTATSENFSNPITITLTGTGQADNDIVGQTLLMNVQETQ